MYSRRIIFCILAALAAFPLAPAAARADAPLTIILPYPKGAFDAVVRSIAEPLSDQLKRDVEIAYVPGDGGWEAIARLRSADPADTVLADAEMTLALKQQTGGRQFTFDQLRPVAKITDGFSVALIAPAGANYGSWTGLTKTVASRKLTLASTGPHSAFGVAEALLVAVLGGGLTEIRHRGPQAIFDAVSQGSAELGLITTNLIIPFNKTASGSKAEPVATFGAERSPRHPGTPTLAEVSGNDKYDFTFALGLFGNKAMPSSVAMLIYEGLKAAQADPKVVDSPVQANYPIKIHDADVLQAAFDRDLRLLRRLGVH